MAGRPSGPEVRGWAAELERVAAWIGRHFVRTEPRPRSRAVGYVPGLLSGTERKNGWQLTEYLGDQTPDGGQYLLDRANWDADAVRDELMGVRGGGTGDARGRVDR